MKHDVHTLQPTSIGVRRCQIHSQGCLPVIERTAISAQRNNRMPAVAELLAKATTNESGGAADETFHCNESPIRKKGAKAPHIIRMR